MIFESPAKEAKATRNSVLLGACSFFISIILIASIGLTQVEKQLKQLTLNSLQATLTTTHDSLSNIWLKNLYTDISVWASDPTVIANTGVLIKTIRQADILVKSEAQSNLRVHFRELLVRQDALGMFVIAPDYTNLASMRDENVGSQNLIAQWRRTYLAKAFRGAPQLVPPLPSDVLLPDRNGQLMKNYPTMFILVPIRNQDIVTAVLAIRLNPFHTFSHIAQTGLIGATGKTYLIDRQGRLVTENRFNEQLGQIGLIDSGDHSMLNVYSYDPGINLVHGTKRAESPTTLNEDKPYTLMAKTALMGESGSSTTAYRDYRGVPVLGAWLWDKELDLGFTTEIDEHEVLSSYRSTQITIMAMLIIMLLLGFIGLFLMRRLQRRATESLEKSEAYQRIVLENVVDGIITSDENGAIEIFNTAAESIFGYSSSEVVGKNIDVLMEEPYRKAHTEYMRNFSVTERSVVMGKGRELEGLRKDGSIIPIRVGLSSSQIRGKRIFTGIVQDLTEQKKKETELRNVTLAVEQSPVGIIISDHDGDIEYVNPAYCKMTGYAWEDLVGQNTRVFRSHPGSIETYREL